MFREALTTGAESTFAIEKATFAEVCKAHGLVKLVDTEGLNSEYEELRLMSELEHGRTTLVQNEKHIESEDEGEEEGDGEGGGDVF